MKEVVLVFPDSHSLTEFILVYKINNIDVSSCSRTLTGKLSDELISIACSKHKAEIQKMTPISYLLLTTLALLI